MPSLAPSTRFSAGSVAGRTRRKLCLFGLAVALPLAVVSSASAQPSDAKSKARALFEAGATAVEAGKPADGLPKLLEAESLFHAPTNLLYIARAQASLGKLLDSKATYEKLIGEKLAARAPTAFKDAVTDGRKELTELERRIPKVLVKAEPVDAAHLDIVMNGASLDAEKIGVPFAVDPGQYSFEAKADDLEAQKVTVDAAERTTTEVRLLLHAVGATPTANDGKSVVVRRDEGGSGEEGFTAIQLASFPMMGVGGAGLVVGGILVGLHFVSQGEADDLADKCAPSCTPAEVAAVGSKDDDAAAFGTGGIIALSAGAAIATAGVVMFFVGGDSGSAPTSSDAKVTVTPLVGPGFVGVTGTF